MELKEIQKILLKHCVVLDEKRMITGMTTRMTTACAKELKEAIDVIQCCEPLKGIEAMQFEQWLCKYKFEKVNNEIYRKGRSDYDVKQLLKLYKMTH